MPERGGGADSPPPDTQPETVLAIDFGTRRVGIAVGQSITGTASPIVSINAKDGVPDWAELDRLIENWGPEFLVVGLPINMDGTESEMSGRARRFAGRLKERYSMPVELTDERLTTREAKKMNSEADDHAVAARLIAETWLAERHRTRR